MKILKLQKKNGWHFIWKTEHNKDDRSVFKLIKSDEPDAIQGLLSLSDLEGYVYVHLAESAPLNFGANKLHEGVGGICLRMHAKDLGTMAMKGLFHFRLKLN